MADSILSVVMTVPLNASISWHTLCFGLETKGTFKIWCQTFFVRQNSAIRIVNFFTSINKSNPLIVLVCLHLVHSIWENVHRNSDLCSLQKVALWNCRTDARWDVRVCVVFFVRPFDCVCVSEYSIYLHSSSKTIWLTSGRLRPQCDRTIIQAISKYSRLVNETHQKVLHIFAEI